MYFHTLDEELKNFYKTNEIYLVLVYRNENDFIECIKGLNYDNFTRYDIVNCNIKIAKERYVENENEHLNQLEKQYHQTKDVKEFNKLEKEIRNLNKIIDKKIKFIATFYRGLSID